MSIVSYFLTKSFMNLFGDIPGFISVHGLFFSLNQIVLLHFVFKSYKKRILFIVAIAMLFSLNLYTLGSGIACFETIYMFFGNLAVYTAYERRYTLSSIFAGLSLLSKLGGFYYLFIIALILIIRNKEIRQYLNRYLTPILVLVLFLVIFVSYETEILGWWVRYGSKYKNFILFNKLTYLKYLFYSIPVFFLPIIALPFRFEKRYMSPILFFLALFFLRAQITFLWYYHFVLYIPLVLMAACGFNNIYKLIDLSKVKREWKFSIIAVLYLVVIGINLGGYSLYNIKMDTVYTSLSKTDLPEIRNLVYAHCKNGKVLGHVVNLKCLFPNIIKDVYDTEAKDKTNLIKGADIIFVPKYSVPELKLDPSFGNYKLIKIIGRSYREEYLYVFYSKTG